MIRRHKIVNFKSFKTAEIFFKDFNILIGKNATGKTNLVQSLDFIAHIISVKNLDDARKYLGVTYIDSVTNASTDSSSFGFEVDLETDTGLLFYKIEFNEGANSTKTLSIVSEQLMHEKDGLIFTRVNNEIKNASGGIIPLSVESKDVAVSLFKDANSRKFTTKMSQMFLSNNIDFESRDFASSNPKHLSYILNKLFERKEDYKAFEEVAQKVIPSFNGFEAIETSDKKQDTSLAFLLRQAGINSYFSTYSSSTGDMKTLYLLAAMFIKSHNTTLIVEEIENGLHPERLRILLEFIQKIATKRDVQLIITTHSPMVINVVSANSIQFLSNKNGASTISQVEHHMTKDIQDHLNEGGSLSDYLKLLT